LENAGGFVSDREVWLDSLPSHKFDNLEGVTHGSSIMVKSINAPFAEEQHRENEQAEKRKWNWLRNELSAGFTAAESEFLPLNAKDLISKAKRRKKAGAC
jgi:hypothetical protein